MRLHPRSRRRERRGAPSAPLAALAALLSLLVPVDGASLQAVEPAAAEESADLSAHLIVPSGLEATLWAESPLLRNPTSIDVDERGRVWVAEAVNYRGYNNRDLDPLWRARGDRIVILEDTDDDGRADSSRVFVEEEALVSPLGVAVLGRLVVVSCSPSLIVYERDDEDRILSREVVLTGFGGLDHDHSLHELEGGPDGRWYLNAGNAGPHIVTDRAGWTLRAGSWYTGGSPHNVENSPSLRSDDGRVWTGGVLLRMEPDATGLEVLGHGCRNPYGSCVDSFGEVWLNDNDDTQSCRTTWLLRGSSCGYDSADGARSWSADRRPGQTVRDAHWRQDDPGVMPSGHVYGNGAPTGITHYESSALGPAWAGGVLLSCEAGQNVVWAYRREPEGAGFRLDAVPFLTTVETHDPNYVWSERPEDRRKWFRPSDVAVGVDGSVFVADWFDPIVGGHRMVDRQALGAIYVVRKAGAPRERTRPHDTSTLDGALRALASPAVNVRHVAVRELARMGADAAPRLRELVTAGDRLLRARALWGLALLGEAGRDDVVAALDDGDPEIRALALRALDRVGADTSPALRALARDPSPAVRREVALLVRDLPLERCEEIIVDLAERWFGGDRWYLEALGTACEGKEEAMYATLLGALGGPPRLWSERFAAIAWRLHPESAVWAFEERALDEGLGERQRRQALDALAFSPGVRAGEAMLRAALEGPADLRSYAAWWIRHREANDWRGRGLRAKLDSALTRRPEEPAWRSDVVRQGGVPVDLDITGAKTLWLVVDGADDGISCDWADWIDPVLEGPNGATRLTTLDWTSAETGYGEIHKGASCRGLPLRVGGARHEDGIGTHAPSVIVYDIRGRGFTRFRALAGVDDGGPDIGGSDHVSKASSVRFSVYLEGPSALDRALAERARLLDADTAADEREDIARALAETAEGGSILISLAAEGKLPDELRSIVAETIFLNPDRGVRALASSWFERPGLEGRSFPSFEQLLELRGDASRGQRIFHGEKAGCASCHVFAEEGRDVGPALTSIREKYDRAALLDALLNPSAAILAGYEAWVVVTRDGRSITGLLVADGETMVLKDSAGEKQTVDRADVVYRRVQTTSLMPDNVATGLEPQEIADVVEFLLRGGEAGR